MRKLIAFCISFFMLINHSFAVSITISAASSLTNAFKDIAVEFEKQNPDVKVQLNFASSGQLVQQIISGAPVDVFASADQETMDKLHEKNLIKKSDRKDFVSNSLVVIVPLNAKKIPSALSELADAKYQRVAIGLPASVPVGKYTKEVLVKNLVWPQIEGKMIGSQNVRQVLDYVARGEVDAGFVYATDAVVMAEKVKLAFAVPTDKKILYPIAPIVGSSNYQAAQKFIHYVQSEKGRAILNQYGFNRP